MRVLLQTILQPIGLSTILVLAGIVSRQPLISIAGIAVLWLLSTPIVSDVLLRPLERAFPALEIALCPEADAVAVISGNIINGLNRTGVQWGPSCGRFHDGVRLMLAQKAPLLILAGAASIDGAAPSQGEILRNVAVDRGLSPQQILVTPPVSTTADEVEAIGALCQTRGIRSIIVVTSAWHMPRTMRLSRKTGLTSHAFPTDYRVPERPGFALARILPRARTLANSDAAVHEYWGLLWTILAG